MPNSTEGKRPIEIRNVSDIKLVPYGDTFGDTVLWCDPSRADVQSAIDERQLEERNYQTDLGTLEVEWKHASNNGQDHAEWVRQVRSYHAPRVAYFVTHGLGDPISVTADGRITDGSHRIRAAIFLGIKEIQVCVVE